MMDIAIVAVVVAIGMAVGAYLVTDGLIASTAVRDMFIKANMFGKDLNKTSEDKV